MNRSIISPEKGVKAMFGVFIAALAAAIPMRVYQLLALIDPKTGFYEKESFTIPTLYIILVLAGAAFIFLSYFPEKMPFGGKTEKSKALMVMAFIVAVSFVIEAGVQTSSAFSETASAVVQEGRSEASRLFFTGTGVIKVGAAVFAAVSAVYFAMVGFGYLGYISDISQFKILALAPLVWSALRLITSFMYKINYRNVSDLLLEMFMLSALMFFLIAFARVTADIERGGALRRLYAFGFLSSLMALTITVPKLVLIFTGNSERIVKGYPFSPVVFFIAVFTVCFLFAGIRTRAIAENDDEL